MSEVATVLPSDKIRLSVNYTETQLAKNANQSPSPKQLTETTVFAPPPIDLTPGQLTLLGANAKGDNGSVQIFLASATLLPQVEGCSSPVPQTSTGH
jgi:hypothetical protein